MYFQMDIVQVYPRLHPVAQVDPGPWPKWTRSQVSPSLAQEYLRRWTVGDRALLLPNFTRAP